MSINTLTKEESLKSRNLVKERDAMKPVMDARRKIENREIETDIDLSIEAEVDRVMREFKAA